MNNNFYEKMAQFQPQQQTVIKSSNHARINSEDVKARAMTSAMFGLGGLILSMSLVLATDWRLWPFSIAFGIVVFLAWMYVEMLDAKRLQLPIDIQQTQQAQPQKHTINGTVKNGGRMQLIEFDVTDPYTVTKFAKQVILGGDGFSEKVAKRAGLSQGEFNDMRDQFLRLGWAEWRNPNWHRSGIVLHGEAITWLEKAAEG